ncbi:MAG: hypothetical protein JSS60_09725 [Verrucomicrobia bacterium]|nr:hypothetical protein [Verrucomicrobiota bacterium]
MKRIFSVIFLCLSLSVTANEIDTWSSPPDTISTTGIDSSNPHIAMDAAGNAVALWLENNVVVSKTKLLNMAWSSPTTLSAAGASEPQLVVDPAGNATAIWVESGVVKTATKLFNLAWGSATTLSGAGSSTPQLAVDTAGDVVAVWLTSGGVQSKTQLFGMSWSGSADVLSASASAAPQVNIGPNGTVVAVWHALNGVTSIFNVTAATKTISGSWSASSIVSDPSINSVYPQVAVDQNGNADAIWFTYNLSGTVYSNVVLQSAYRPAVGSWATPVNVSQAGKRNPADLVAKVNFSDAGNVIAIWTNSNDGETFRIDSAQTDLNLNWTGTEPIITNLYAYTVDLALNSIGDAFAVYMAYDSSSSSIVINAVESHVGGFAAGFWGSPVTISLGTENGFPKIGAVIVGGTNCYAAAAWINNDGSNNIIQSSFGNGIAVVPPSNLAVVQQSTNFGVFTEYYNVLSWTASTDPNLNSYIIYRNGQIVTFIDATTMPLQFIDNNRVQNGPVVYGVSAIDSADTESAIITVNFP